LDDKFALIRHKHIVNKQLILKNFENYL